MTTMKSLNNKNHNGNIIKISQFKTVGSSNVKLHANISEVHQRLSKNGERFYTFLLVDDTITMWAFSKNEKFFEELKENTSYQLCAEINVKLKDKRFNQSTSKYELWFNEWHSCTENKSLSKRRPSLKSGPLYEEDPTTEHGVGQSSNTTYISTISNPSLKKMKVLSITLYRYLGCVNCTKSMSFPNEERKFICSSCKSERQRKFCFVARQMILRDVLGAFEDISVVAYDSEIVKLLGGREASSFQRDDDARVAANKIIGAIISLELTNKKLSPKKARIVGVEKELLAMNIHIIEYPATDVNNNGSWISQQLVGMQFQADGDSFEDEESVSSQRPKKCPTRKHITPFSRDISDSTCAVALERKYDHAETEKRGLALIINNLHYEGERNNDRIGSNKDVVALLTMLRVLAYDVFVPTRVNHDSSGVVVDPSNKDFTTVIEEFKINLSQKDALSSMIFIMGHGSWGHVTLQNGSPISLWTDIVYQFSEEKFPDFSGKPKMFFVEACQNFKTIVSAKPPQQLSHDTNADTLVVVSSMPGKPSYLYPGHGSIFIQKLCPAFTNLRVANKPLHLLEIIKALQISMNKENIRVGDNFYKQMLDYTDMAFKRFYL